MIKLEKTNLLVQEEHSSKGNQFKWMKDGIWYKADYLGYACQKYGGKEVDEKIRYLVTSIERITGLRNFGKYLTMLLEIDAVFLNEDRHTHNIAAVRKENGDFRLCPVFDNGASMFSDTAKKIQLFIRQ